MCACGIGPSLFLLGLRPAFILIFFFLVEVFSFFLFMSLKLR